MAKVKQTISIDSDLYDAANRAAGVQMAKSGQAWTFSKVVNEALDMYIQHIGVTVENTSELVELIDKQQAKAKSPYKSLELDKRSKITKGLERVSTTIGNTDGLDEFMLAQEEDGKA